MVSCVSPHRRHAAVTPHQSGSLGKRMSKKKKKKKMLKVLESSTFLFSSPPTQRQETPPILIYSRTILSNIFITLSPRPYLITLIYGEGGESVCFFFFLLLLLARHPRVPEKLLQRRLTRTSLRCFGCFFRLMQMCQLKPATFLLPPRLLKYIPSFHFFSLLFIFFFEVGFISSPWLIPQIHPII